MPTLFPRPQWMHFTLETFDPGDHLKVLQTCQGCQTAAQVLEERLAPLGFSLFRSGYPVRLGLLSEPAVTDRLKQQWVTVMDEVRQTGGYVLDIRQSDTLIAGYDAAGVFYGAQSFLQFLLQHRALPMGTAQDWPYKPLRGVHLYMPGRQDIPFFKRFVKWLASLKYNTLFLEVGGGMRYDRHPEINAGWEKFCKEAEAYPGGPEALQSNSTRFIKDSTHTELGGGSFLEKAEVRELVDFANSLFIEVIPEAQSLSHSYYLCTAHPEIAELAEDPWPDTYCPSNPKSYELYFDVLEEVIEVFHPRILHIGHDEVYNLGVCPACRGKSGSELLAGDLLRIHGFLMERGVRMAMWGDTLLPFTINGWEGGVARTIERESGARAVIPEMWRAVEQLPRDVLISEWQGNTDPRAMQFFLREGFEVYCGNFGDNFAAHRYPQWNERSKSPAVLGGEPSTWCEVSEFAFGYNACIFNMLFSAQLLWWRHYRGLERENLSKEVAAQMPVTRYLLSGETVPSRRKGARLIRLTPQGRETDPLPFAHELAGVCLDAERPTAELLAGMKLESLQITSAAVCQRLRQPTWALVAVHQYPAEDLVAEVRVRYADGSSATLPVYYGTHVGQWDVPFAEHVDAVPYLADPLPVIYNFSGQRVTLYRCELVLPNSAQPVASFQVTFKGNEQEQLWLVKCEGVAGPAA